MFDAVSIASNMGIHFLQRSLAPSYIGRSSMTKNKPFLAIVLLISCASIAPAQSTQTTSGPAAEASLAPPEHPATADQIREYLSLTNAIESAHKAMAQSLKTSRTTSAPYFTASFWDDMETAVMNLDMVPPLITAYQKYFSQEDMAATIAFYKSPAGQRLLAAQPYITSVASDVLRDLGRQAGEQVGLKHQEEIQRLMKQSQPVPLVNSK
jgi:uncharacterized protein